MISQTILPLMQIAKKNSPVRQYSQVVHLGDTEACVTDGYAMVTCPIATDPGRDTCVKYTGETSQVKFPQYSSVKFTPSTPVDTSLLVATLKGLSSNPPKCRDLPFHLVVRDGKLVLGTTGEVQFNPWLVRKFLLPLIQGKQNSSREVTALLDTSDCGRLLIKCGEYSIYILGLKQTEEERE